MYEGSPAWQPYYLELEPERRALMLKRLLEEEADDGSNAWRKKLFELRYLKKGEKEPSVDRFLWQCVNFIQICSAPKLFKKSGKKEVIRFLTENGFYEAAASGINGERALYWETRNAAKRYFKTCRGSEYRRSLFGLISPGKNDQENQMKQDAMKMTSLLEEKLDMPEDLYIWSKAVMDEYLSQETGGMING